MNTYDFYFEDMTIRFVDKEDFFTNNLEIWISLSPAGFVIADSYDVLLIEDMDKITISKLKDEAKTRLGVPLKSFVNHHGNEDFEAYTRMIFSVLSETDPEKDFDVMDWNITEAHDYFKEAVLRPTAGMQVYL